MDHGYAVLIQILYRPQGSQVWGEVQGNCNWGCHAAKSSNRMLCKTEEYHLNTTTLQLCLWIMPSHHLLYGNVCWGKQTNLRYTPTGVPTLIFFKLKKHPKKGWQHFKKIGSHVSHVIWQNNIIHCLCWRNMLADHLLTTIWAIHFDKNRLSMQTWKKA